MEVNEIIGFLEENPDAQSAIKEKFDLVPQSEIIGLKNNWYEIKNEKKKLQAKLKAYNDFEPEMIEDYNRLKAMEDDLNNGQGKTKKNDGDNIDNQVKQRLNLMQKKLDSVVNESTQYKQKFYKSEMKSKINEALNNVKIRPAFRDMLVTNFMIKSKIEEFDNKTELYYNDSEKGEIPFSSHVKDFFQSETGQEYLMKPENSGGGARGNNKSQSGATLKRAQYDNLTPGEQADAASRAAKGELKIVD